MATDPAARPPDALEHPLYRVAHLHGSEWVTLRPEEQHDPSHAGMTPPWSGSTIYRCDRCGERVIVAPSTAGGAAGG